MNAAAAATAAAASKPCSRLRPRWPHQQREHRDVIIEHVKKISWAGDAGWCLGESSQDGDGRVHSLMEKLAKLVAKFVDDPDALYIVTPLLLTLHSVMLRQAADYLDGGHKHTRKRKMAIGEGDRRRR